LSQTIEKIIKNPIYCGIIKVWDNESKGNFEPIISENLFYLCQKDVEEISVKNILLRIQIFRLEI